MHSVLMQLFFYFENSLNLPRIHRTTVQHSAEVCLCGSSSRSRLLRMCTEAFCLCFTVRPKHMGVPAAVPSPKMLNIPQVPLPVKPGVSVWMNSGAVQTAQRRENDVLMFFFPRLSSGPALVPRPSGGAQPGSGLGGQRRPRAEQLQQHSSWREAHTAVWEVLSHQPGPGRQPQPHRGCFLQCLLHFLLLGEWRELRLNCQVSLIHPALSFAVFIHQRRGFVEKCYGAWWSHCRVELMHGWQD